jgi:AcrR family transcriptional regulator
MPRPPTITDEQILEAAREVFLAKGASATTAEVARRAGVAEGSIFNRFKNKAELFRAAMVPPIAEVPWLKTLVTRVGKGDIRDTLNAAGLQAIEFFRQILPLMMMGWSNPEEGGLPQHFREPDAPPLRAIRTLSGFFEAEMRAGRLRRHDPEIMARCWLGSIQNYVFFELLLKAQDQLPLPAETFIRGMVNLLWTGAQPQKGRS